MEQPTPTHPTARTTTKQRKRYRVRATMFVALRGHVEAVNEHHAVALAKKLADDGHLDEDPWLSEIHEFEAEEARP